MSRQFSAFQCIGLFVIFCTAMNAWAGEISGKVTDIETGNALPGANIVIKGTSLGTASDIEGHYFISNVPPGTYEVAALYIGYAETSATVTITTPRDKIRHDIGMKFIVIEGQEVTVTAQAEGQMQAINQQLSSKTIKNIVSKKQIQELPEANAAEAVGRLPGVSLERSGGEGNKVVIRGMASKYSMIQIDGVTMAATGSGDRSTDLSMISPYMLEGIELTKSVMANQEATATGGIVNFRIKKAPDDPSFNLIAQGGHNNLRGTYSDYKLSVGGSNRFYANLLGIYAQVDYEEKDAGSQQLGGVGFFQENESKPVQTNSMQLMDIFRNVKRLGGALVVDYTLPATTIKSSNFYSRINRHETSFTNNYNYKDQAFNIGYTDTPDSWLTVLTNSLQLDHRFKNLEINSVFSHSFSENILPNQISSSAGWPTVAGKPFSTDRNAKYNVDLDPRTIPDSLVTSIEDAAYFMTLGGISHEESKTRERDISGQLDLKYTFNITDKINVNLNVGGKYRHKNKEYDRTNLVAYNDGGNQEYRNLVYDGFEDELSDRAKEAWAENNMNIYLWDFFDDGYDRDTFFDGRYYFSPVLDKEKFRRIHQLAMDSYDPTSTSRDVIVVPNFINSNYYDYNGTEDYYAFYVMPEINVGPKFLFVPGVRYEANQTEYTGYRGNRLGVLRDFTVTPIDTVTKGRKNEFILPMIQTFYKPTDWLTVKAGYTHTLQRPNYNNMMPGYVINNQGQIGSLGNFRLKPELARNWDLQASFHSNTIGLLSVGVFHKTISDMIFWTGNTVILDTTYFELPALMHRKIGAYATNNPNDVINYGYEVEWKSNFWYLPGLLKGLVLNFNYTHNESKAKYLRTRIDVKAEFDENYNLITYYTPNDTTYSSPMVGQPDHLLNLTLGYDYKGFSIRCAMRYKSNIFKSTNWYEKLRGYSTDFYRYDFSVRQQLPVKGLEFFLNVNNLTNEKEQDVINHMSFTRYLQDYGRTANVGLRYQF